MQVASHPQNVLSQSCDTHVHIFDPDRFPYAKDRAYTPGKASVANLQAIHKKLGIKRVVVVQPSIYGTDNACLLDAIESFGLDRARGIAVVDLAAISEKELQRLHAGGVRGVRLNLNVNGYGLEQVKQQIKASKRIKAIHGWHLQVHANLDLHVSVLDDYVSLGVPVVLDHYAGGMVPDPESEIHFLRLLDAMRAHPIYVKLSAPYRIWSGCSSDGLARSLYKASPDKILWASDWPHTGGSGGSGRNPNEIEPFRDINTQQDLARTLRVIGGSEAQQRVLVDNPACLYGFND